MDFLNKFGFDKSGLEKKLHDTGKKLPDTSEIAKKQITVKIEGKISSINGLATTAALNAVENKIPNIINLVKKKKKKKKKQIMMQKYETLNLNILPHLIITNFRMKYLVQI